MIQAVSSLELTVTGDASLRIAALQKAYAQTAALQLYRGDNGSIAALCDGKLYLECADEQAEEWILFAAMNPMIDCVRSTPKAAQLYAEHVNGRWEKQAVMTPKSLMICQQPITEEQATPQELWQLLQAGFGESAPPYRAFYADVSHRLRHGCFHQRVVRGEEGLLACAMTVALYDTAAMIGAVATHPCARRRGYASACVTQLAASLQHQGKKVFLCPKNQYAQQLYTALGFAVEGECGIGYAEK